MAIITAHNLDDITASFDILGVLLFRGQLRTGFHAAGNQHQHDQYRRNLDFMMHLTLVEIKLASVYVSVFFEARGPS